MIKNIIISLGILFFSLTTYAQTHSPTKLNSEEFCNFKPINFKINFKEENISYNYNLSSKQIQNLKQVKKSHNDLNSSVLGLFTSELSVKTESELSEHSGIINNVPTKCSYLNKLSVTITYKPVIYISKEAQKFNCTYNQVLNHERLHYRYDKDSFYKINSYIESIFRKHFNNLPINYNNQLNYQQIINSKNNNFFQEYTTLVEKDSTPKHESIDTPENYKKETLLCGKKENNLLSNILR